MSPTPYPSPQVERVTTILEMIGVNLQPEHVTEIIGWVPLIVASVFTYLGVRMKVQSDRQTTVTDALRQDNAALRAENAALKQDNRQLEADKDEAERERDDAQDKARRAEGTNRDQAEVLTAVVRDLMARTNWNGEPPPPELSWRTTEYLNPPGDT